MPLPDSCRVTFWRLFSSLWMTVKSGSGRLPGAAGGGGGKTRRSRVASSRSAGKAMTGQPRRFVSDIAARFPCRPNRSWRSVVRSVLASKWSHKTSRIRRIGNRLSGTFSLSFSGEHALLDYQRRRRQLIPPNVGHDSATARKVPTSERNPAPLQTETVPHFDRNPRIERTPSCTRCWKGVQAGGEEARLYLAPGSILAVERATRAAVLDCMESKYVLKRRGSSARLYTFKLLAQRKPIG